MEEQRQHSGSARDVRLAGISTRAAPARQERRQQRRRTSGTPKGRSGSASCQVPGCCTTLGSGRKYHARYKICEEHARQPEVLVDGILQRFCQQHGRFHPLPAFQGQRRSCTRGLERHRAVRSVARCHQVQQRASAAGCQGGGAAEAAQAAMGCGSSGAGAGRPQQQAEGSMSGADACADSICCSTASEGRGGRRRSLDPEDCCSQPGRARKAVRRMPRQLSSNAGGGGGAAGSGGSSVHRSAAAGGTEGGGGAASLGLPSSLSLPDGLLAPLEESLAGPGCDVMMPWGPQASQQAAASWPPELSLPAGCAGTALTEQVSWPAAASPLPCLAATGSGCCQLGPLSHRLGQPLAPSTPQGLGQLLPPPACLGGGAALLPLPPPLGCCAAPRVLPHDVLSPPASGLDGSSSPPSLSWASWDSGALQLQLPVPVLDSIVLAVPSGTASPSCASTHPFCSPAAEPLQGLPAAPWLVALPALPTLHRSPPSGLPALPADARQACWPCAQQAQQPPAAPPSWQLGQPAAAAAAAAGQAAQLPGWAAAVPLVCEGPVPVPAIDHAALEEELDRLLSVAGLELLPDDPFDPFEEALA